MGREGYAVNRVLVDEPDCAGANVHQGGIHNQDEGGVSFVEVSEEVFGNGAGVDEFYRVWHSALQVFDYMGTDAIVGFEIVAHA